jgi:ABC transport system ATP-binding/permease protein
VISIGRRNTNDIVIDDMRISRLHAQIRLVPDGYMIFDTGSTGGTFVNSARISQQLLKTGDVISLGGYRFIFLQENLKDSTKPYQRDMN